ncbi:hypothetical protein K170097C1_01640 [Hungatella effluvii]
MMMPEPEIAVRDKSDRNKDDRNKMTETKGVGKWQVSERWPDLPGWLPVQSPAH